jgi:hypothetical protein
VLFDSEDDNPLNGPVSHSELESDAEFDAVVVEPSASCSARAPSFPLFSSFF